MQQHSYKSGSCALKICATKGVHLTVRYNFGTTEGEKEWPSGSQATPNEALGFSDCIFRDQEVGGSNPLAPTTSIKSNNLDTTKEQTTSKWLTSQLVKTCQTIGGALGLVSEPICFRPSYAMKDVQRDKPDPEVYLLVAS